MIRHLLLLAVGIGGSLAFGDTINLSTGLDASGNLITTDLACDAHWTVDGIGACSPNAQVVMSEDQDWSTPWVPDGPQSNWIARNAGQKYGNGFNTYSVQFFLPTTAGASLNGEWTIDDIGTISLNGHLLGFLPDVSWGSLFPVSAPASDFVTGVNTLSISITLSDIYLEGVRFQGGVSFTPVPEPPSRLLLLAGLGIMAIIVRLRRSSRSAA